MPQVTLGRTVATRGVAERMADVRFSRFVQDSLARHESGDWGELEAEDVETNDRALVAGERLLSAYSFEGTKIWVITEWDRSVTTVLFPEEY